MFMIEINDRYSVTQDGKIWSKKNNRFLKQSDNGNGYKKVAIRVDGRYKQLYVHRLVAAAYIPNPYDLKEVNHIDFNKDNNNASNLEWCSPIDNMNHFLQSRGRRLSDAYRDSCQERFNSYINAGVDVDIALYALH